MGAAIPSERTQKSITRKFRSNYFCGLIFRIVVNIRVYSHAVLSDSRCTQWLTLRSIEFRAALWKPRCTVFVFPFLKEKMSHRSSDFKNGVKATVDGLWSKWKVHGPWPMDHGSTTGRSAKVECPEIREWTLQRAKTGRSKGMEPDGPKRGNWTVSTLDSQGIIRNGNFVTKICNYPCQSYRLFSTLIQTGNFWK